MSQQMRTLIDRIARASAQPILDRLTPFVDDEQAVLLAVIREAVRDQLTAGLSDAGE